jgi:Spy/CpxP family protein refolding chaperone
MNKKYIPVLRALVAGVTSAMLTFAFATPASAAPAPDGSPKMAHNWAGYREHQAHLQEHLDKEAKRLGINAAQQPQWDAYVKAVESPVGDLHRLPPDADAATIARQHADFAAGHAAKLARIADATAALQAVLTPEQQRTLAHIVRHAGPHGWHMARNGAPHPDGSVPAGAPAE